MFFLDCRCCMQSTTPPASTATATNTTPPASTATATTTALPTTTAPPTTTVPPTTTAPPTTTTTPPVSTVPPAPKLPPQPTPHTCTEGQSATVQTGRRPTARSLSRSQASSAPSTISAEGSTSSSQMLRDTEVVSTTVRGTARGEKMRFIYSESGSLVSSRPVSSEPGSTRGSSHSSSSSSSSTAAKDSPDVPDFLLCPICQDFLQSPVVLSCGHSLCAECCVSLRQERLGAIPSLPFECPICKSLVLNFAPNYTLRQAIISPQGLGLRQNPDLSGISYTVSGQHNALGRIRHRHPPARFADTHVILDDSDPFFDEAPKKKRKKKSSTVTPSQTNKKKRGRPKKTSSDGGAGGGKDEVKEEKQYEVDCIFAHSFDQQYLWVRWVNGEETKEKFHIMFADVPVLVMEFLANENKTVRD